MVNRESAYVAFLAYLIRERGFKVVALQNYADDLCRFESIVARVRRKDGFPVRLSRSILLRFLGEPMPAGRGSASLRDMLRCMLLARISDFYGFLIQSGRVSRSPFALRSLHDAITVKGGKA